MLLPTEDDVARALNKCQKSVRLSQVFPGEPSALARLDSSAYTLCVLMGERQVGRAVAAAEKYLQTPDRPSATSTS